MNVCWGLCISGSDTRCRCSRRRDWGCHFKFSLEVHWMQAVSWCTEVRQDVELSSKFQTNNLNCVSVQWRLERLFSTIRGSYQLPGDHQMGHFFGLSALPLFISSHLGQSYVQRKKFWIREVRWPKKMRNECLSKAFISHLFSGHLTSPIQTELTELRTPKMELRLLHSCQITLAVMVDKDIQYLD